MPKKAANGSSEQNPKDAAAQSDRPEAPQCEDPAVKKTSVADGAAKKRPRRKAVAKETKGAKETKSARKTKSGKDEKPAETAPSAREVVTRPSLPLGPISLDTRADASSKVSLTRQLLM